MKDTLKEIFDKFGQSKAVFVGSKKKGLGYDGDIVFKVKDKYDVKSAPVDTTDSIALTMMSHYSEQFDRHAAKWEKSTSCIDQTMRDIFMDIKTALINAMPLKNPQQSKLYKWFEYGTINTLAKREGIIALYRYIQKHTNEDFRFKEGSENPHAKNVVAILEKMKEKYE